MLKFWILALASFSSLSALADSRSAIIAIAAGATTGTGSFVADEDYTGGSPYPVTIPIDTTHAMSPAPAAVYDNCRYGNFSYTIPGLAAGGMYLVRLHFAEVYWSAAGARVFNAFINGTRVLNNFDVYADAGGKGVADVRQFQAAADATGKITIQFTSVVDNAMVNGIEVYPAGTLPFPAPSPGYNLALSSNQVNYAVGSTATILANLQSLPANPEQSFFVSATFNGNAIGLSHLTNTESYAVTPALTSGASLFMAQVYLENAKEAQALGETVSFYQRDIAKLQAELAVTTDPNAIATINAQIAHDQDRLAATQAEQWRIRSPFGAPVTITLWAQ